MPSDGKEPGAIWEDAPDSYQAQGASQQSQQAEQVHLTPNGSQLNTFSPQLMDGGLLHLNSDFVEDEKQHASRSDPYQASAAPSGNLLKQFWQYLMLILAPLLFGALTCVFVLPPIATGNASIPPSGLWVVLLLIIAVAVAQGLAVYYAGENNSLWALATVGGFTFFLLIGCFTLFGMLVGIVLFGALLVLCVALVRYYLHPVATGFVDLVSAFGKYSRTLHPGFNILLPWEKVSRSLATEEKQWICSTQKIQLSREEEVTLRATISYQLVPEDAHLAVSQVGKWEESLRELLQGSLQTIATTFCADDFLAWPQGLYAEPIKPESTFLGNHSPWERINMHLTQQICEKAALWGVQVNWVHIRDIKLGPCNSAVSQNGHGDNSSQVTEVDLPVQTTLKANHTSVPAQTTARPTAKPAVQPITLSASAPSSTAGQKITTPAQPLKEEVLIKAYKQVQDGKITDPNTIRSIASRFAAIANDPSASQSVSFDAQRACSWLMSPRQKIYSRRGISCSEQRC